MAALAGLTDGGKDTLGEDLLELLVRARRERLKVSLYRWFDEIEIEVYATGGDFKLHETGGLEQIVRQAGAAVTEHSCQLVEADWLAERVRRLFALAERGGLALTLGFSFPSSGEPWFGVDARPEAGGRAVCQIQRPGLQQALDEGLAKITAYDPPFEAQPRQRLSPLADPDS